MSENQLPESFKSCPVCAFWPLKDTEIYVVDDRKVCHHPDCSIARDYLKRKKEATGGVQSNQG